MAIEFYLSDDSTLLSDEVLDPVAGGTSSTLEVHVWNEKGNPTGQDVGQVLIVLEVEDPTNPGTWLRSGLPPQDELWMEVRVTDQDNAGDTAQEAYVVDWQRIGASRALALPTLNADCARYVEIRWRAPSFAAGLSYRWHLVPLVDTYSIPVPFGADHVRGILTGFGDPARSGIIRGGVVTASGSPDEFVHLEPTLYLYRGQVYGVLTTDVELDQDDSAAATLAVGESYWAVLTLDATGVVSTKWLKGASPTKPTPPAGIFLKWVRVDYTGATSSIETADLDGDLVRDRFHVETGAGLDLVVHAGQALGGGTKRIASGLTPVSGVTDDATSFLWQLAAGTYELTADDVPPEDGALILAEVTAASGSITEIVDRRVYVEPLIVFRFAGPDSGVGELSPPAITSVYPRLAIEGVVFVVDAVAGVSGRTAADVLIDGVSIYTDSGTEDERPSIPFDATSTITTGGVHQVTVIPYGSLIEADIVEEPVGGASATEEILVLCRELR